MAGPGWISPLGPNDVITVGGHASTCRSRRSRRLRSCRSSRSSGRLTADQWEPGINAVLAATGVGFAWWLLGRLGVRSLVDRFWLVLLFGFSTQIWWVTTRGGVWHTGQLIATILTLRRARGGLGRAATVAPRAAGGRRVPDAGSARIRRAVLRADAGGTGRGDSSRHQWRADTSAPRARLV